MKTVVITGISCLLLAGVVYVLKKGHFSGNLSLTQNLRTAASLAQGENEQAATTKKATQDVHSVNQESKDTSNLIDSHWLDEDAFQKAVQDELHSEREASKADVPMENIFPETTAPASPAEKREGPAEEPIPGLMQLILELTPDTTTNKKVPVEVV